MNAVNDNATRERAELEHITAAIAAGLAEMDRSIDQLSRQRERISASLAQLERNPLVGGAHVRTA